MSRLLPGLLLAAALCAGCEVGVGQDCSASVSCPDGLSCSFPRLPGGTVSERGVCDYPLRGEGEPCTRAAECESALTCSNHFEAGGRYGSCVQKRAAGQACFMDRDCSSGTCQGESGTALDGTCG